MVRSSEERILELKEKLCENEISIEKLLEKIDESSKILEQKIVNNFLSLF